MQFPTVNKSKKTGAEALDNAITMFYDASLALASAEDKLKTEIATTQDQIKTLQEKAEIQNNDLSRAERIREKLLSFIE